VSDFPSDPSLRFAHEREGSPPARLVRAAHAAEELCGALWEAVRDELRQPCAPRVAELAERLAQVCAAVAVLAAEEPAPELESRAATEWERPAAPEWERSAVPEWERPAASERKRPAVPEPQPPVLAGAPEIAIHDARHEGGEGPVAWIESLETSLERHREEGLPFAVLLVEALDVERLTRAEPAAALTDLLDRVQTAIERELRPADTLVRESSGRWWLTASRTDSCGARALAERLARAACAAAVHRGQPLGVAVGTAACPAHGEEATTLAAHADVDLYAARAMGRPVAPMDDAA
jgi:GGDEF domain-containing protein